MTTTTTYIDDRVADVRIGTELVELTARPTDRAASGWSIAAFTSTCALRSTKCNDAEALRRFANAIAAACDDEGFIADADVVLLEAEIQTLMA